MYVNSEDPDQTPLSAAPDLGLHCLLRPHLLDTRYKWFTCNTLKRGVNDILLRNGLVGSKCEMAMIKN